MSRQFVNDYREIDNQQSGMSGCWGKESKLCHDFRCTPLQTSALLLNVLEHRPFFFSLKKSK